MKIITIALGETYVASARAMQSALPSLKIVTELLDTDRNANPFVAARLGKSNFAEYLPSADGDSVLLLDADLVAIDASALSELALVASDVAGVMLQPPDKFNAPPYDVVPPGAAKFNSGFLYFRDGNTARSISRAWRRHYGNNIPGMLLDEPNLALALHELGSRTQELPGKFNSLRLPGAAFYHPAPNMRGERGARIRGRGERRKDEGGRVGGNSE